MIQFQKTNIRANFEPPMASLKNDIIFFNHWDFSTIYLIFFSLYHWLIPRYAASIFIFLLLYCAFNFCYDYIHYSGTVFMQKDKYF